MQDGVLRLLAPGSDPKEVDYVLVCASRYQNCMHDLNFDDLNFDGLLSQLGFTIDEVPFIGEHKHRESWDLVVAEPYLPSLFEELSRCKIKIEENYNPTIPTAGEIRVHGIIAAENRILSDFFDNALEAERYPHCDGPRRCYHDWSLHMMISSSVGFPAKHLVRQFDFARVLGN